MTRDEIREEIAKIIRSEFTGVEFSSPDDFLMDCGLNSVDMVSLIIILEDVYSIEFNDDDLTIKNFATVNTILDCVCRTKSKK